MVLGLRLDGINALAAVAVILGVAAGAMMLQALWPALFPEPVDSVWPARTQANGCLDTRVIRVLPPPGVPITMDACERSCGAMNAFVYRSDSGRCWCAREKRCNESVPFSR